MLNVHMYSSATKVKGQGVGSAYTELIKLLEKYYPEQLAITINEFSPADISHYHTIDLKFFFSTFSKRRGKKVGYVHFYQKHWREVLSYRGSHVKYCIGM